LLKHFWEDKRKLLIMILIIIAALIAILLISRARRLAAEQQTINAGISYLKSQEAVDLDSVKADIRAAEEEKKQEEKDKVIQQLSADPSSVWTHFGSAVVMGDSRAVGFSYYQCLPESQVFAEGGNTIRNIMDHLDELKTFDPSEIFLCYGLNDVGIRIWSTPDDYAKEYESILQQLQSSLPNAKIYVSSILPAQETAIENKDEIYAEIPDYSNAVKKMVEKDGYGWVDMDEIAEKHADLYDVDGIHLQRDFYPYWGSAMIAATYDTYKAAGYAGNQGTGAGADEAVSSASDGTSSAQTDVQESVTGTSQNQ